MLGVRIAKTENRASKARKPLRHKTLLLHLFCQHTPKSIENLGFRCFFVAKTLKMVWVKMWVNRLTHTVTHIGN